MFNHKILELVLMSMKNIGYISETNNDGLCTIIFKSRKYGHLKFTYNNNHIDHDGHPQWIFSIEDIPVASGRSLIDVSGDVKPAYIMAYLHLSYFKIMKLSLLNGFTVGRVVDIPIISRKQFSIIENNHFSPISKQKIPGVLFTVPQHSLFIFSMLCLDNEGRVMSNDIDYKIDTCTINKDKGFDPRDIQICDYTIKYKDKKPVYVYYNKKRNELYFS